MTIESIRSIIGEYLDLSDPRHAQMMRKVERELTAATCELCGGTGMYGPDAVPCPSGCTPAPQTHVRVKPLVWHDLRGDGSVTATTTIGLQYIASGSAWGFRNYPDLYPVEGGVEVAKSEAQADYELRILPLIATMEGQP